MDRGYIYKANYSGWYSVNDEAFVPETHLKDEVVNEEKVCRLCSKEVYNHSK